jgi:predicted CopG family antitoxin
MTTTKPRITITLENEAYALLQRMSAQRGKSMSAIVTDLLDAAAPSLERAAVLLRQAQLTKEEVEREVEALMHPKVSDTMREIWREQDEERRLAWAASMPQMTERARQPAGTRTAAPATTRKKLKTGARAKNMPPSINKGVRSKVPVSHKGVRKGVRRRAV